MSLQIWLPLNGNLDNQGLNDNITITMAQNGHPSFASDGKISSKSLDTPNNVLVDLLNPLGRQWSFAFWGYIDSSLVSANWTGIARLADNGSNLRVEVCPKGYVANDIYCYSTHNNTSNNITTGSIATQNGTNYYDTWVHFCLTSDGTTITKYMNGVKIGTCPYNGTGNLNGKISLQNNNICRKNDVRLYNHCLSTKEIKELSKGLVLHWKLSNPYAGNHMNLAPQQKGYSTNPSPSWDKALNGMNMYTPSGWSSGYNSGVSSPATGYHAHWVLEDGDPIMLFPNLNESVGLKNRWLGISGYVETSTIPAGEKYTISFDMMSDSVNGGITGGLYYKLTSSATASNFHDGNSLIAKATEANVWKRYSKTFTRSSSYDGNNPSCSMYLYHNYSAECNVWVKNVQLQVGGVATGFVDSGSSIGEDTEYDCSGFCHHGVGAVTLPHVSSDTPRYSYSYMFDGNTYDNDIICNTTDLNINTDCTLSLWYKAPASGYSDKSKIYFGVKSGLGIQFEPDSYSAPTKSRIFISRGANNMSGHLNYLNLSLNEWHFICLVKKNGYLYVYVDGIQVYDIAAEDYDFSSAYNYVGLTTWSGSYFPIGNVSDAIFYVTALSGEDILEMYHTAASVDKYGNLFCSEVIE